MGPTQDRTSPHPKQVRRRQGRPRPRWCLLKGCEKTFRPSHPQARYCSAGCREAAALWREWKAQRRYRRSARGRERRQEQGRRRRGRLSELKRRGERRAGRPIGGAAWVITQQEIFVLVRPARLLRDLRAYPPVSDAAVLLAALPARARTCARARATLAQAVSRAHLLASPATALVSGAYCPRSTWSRSFGVYPREEGAAGAWCGPVVPFSRQWARAGAWSWSFISSSCATRRCG